MTGSRTSGRLVAFAAVAMLLCGAALSSAQQTPPNVVLIIGDDHGWPYSGFMGDPLVQTPNLDALAAGGTVFRNGHVTASVCMPSLRAILAGIHSDQWETERTAISAVVGAFPRREEVTHFRTLPRELARRGYLSWEGGKMWEGAFWQAGFTHGLATSIGGLFSSVGDQFGRDGWEDGTALDPLRNFFDAAGARPFFTWIAPMLPHVPFNPPPEFRAPYEQLGLPAGEVTYYGNVSWLDAIVGEVLAELDTRGLRDDTLVLYISDNGWTIGQGYSGMGKGKGTLHEMGFRTPLIFNWPGRVPAGVVRDDLVSSLDVMPTILEYAGADPLPDRAGISLVDAIATGLPVGREKIVSHFVGTTASNQGYFVRTPIWRYIASADGREQLYAIATDPYEDLDVAAANPELLAAFRSDVLAWQQQIASAPPLLDAAGSLVGETGAPIVGAELQLVGHTEAGLALRLRVLTSPEGQFRFQSVPRGSYVLTAARRAGHLRFGPFLGRVETPLPLGTLGGYAPLRGQTVGSLPGVSSSTIRGLLRSDAGIPIAGAAITLRGRAAKPVLAIVRSGSDGRYRAENLPEGVYGITTAAGRSFRRASLRVTLGADADLVADLVALAR